MSRRRGSATALKLSEVVAARDMSELYADIGICQPIESAFTPLDHVFNLSPLSAGRGAGRTTGSVADRAHVRIDGPAFMGTRTVDRPMNPARHRYARPGELCPVHHMHKFTI